MGVIDTLKAPPVLLRILEFVFSLIAWATAVSVKYTQPSYMAFAIFTGISGWVLTIVFIFIVFFPKLRFPYFDIVEAVTDFIWMVFFLAAAISMAALNPCGNYHQGACNTYDASIAFYFFSWFLWFISFILSFSVIYNLKFKISAVAPSPDHPKPSPEHKPEHKTEHKTEHKHETTEPDDQSGPEKV